jgi:hypothetical protein
MWWGSSANYAGATIKISSAGSVDMTTGTFGGAISGASIAIGSNAWHVDTSGNMWWGSSANYAGATIKISSAGSVDMTTGTFSGAITGATGTFTGGVSGTGYAINDSLINLYTSTMQIASTSGSATSGVIKMGSTLPQNVGSTGIHLDGTGTFSFVSASSGTQTAWIKMDDAGFSIKGTDDNFSVSHLGAMSAKNASIDGDIRAKSGWFGSSGSGWIITGDQIADFSQTILLDANPEQPSINIVSASYSATLQKDFTAKNTILSTGGNSFDYGPAASFVDDGNGEIDGTNIPGLGGTQASAITYYTWGSAGGPGITFHTSAAPTTAAALTLDKKYKTRVTVKANITALMPNGGNAGGTATVKGDIDVYKYDTTQGHVLMGTFDADATWLFDWNASQTKNYSIVINHNTHPSYEEHWYVKVRLWKVQSNDIVENWDSGAPKWLTYQTPAEIDSVTVWTSQIQHLPSSKALEIAPSGLQGVVLQTAVLESSDLTDGIYDNQAFIMNPSAYYGFELLGDASITGSLNLKKRANADYVNIDPSSTSKNIDAKHFMLQSGGSYRVSTNSQEYILYRDTGDEDGIGFYVQSGHNFQMGDTTHGGNFHADNDIIGFSSVTSDIKFKENIIPIDNSLGRVLQLRGVEFDWKEEYGDKGHDLGFIAQEVEKIEGLDVLVDEKYNIRTKGTAKTVSYEKVVPLLVEAIKEQQRQIDELNKKIEEL